MFELFATQPPTAASNAGTGLGLSIAKEIAESYGGTLSYESVHPHGARFLLTLPAAVPHDKTP
jgi:signal transduction histidine kinase